MGDLPDLRIEGTTGIVTGAANGIGRATAKTLVAAGARVHLADVDPNVLAVAEELGGTAEVCDLAERGAGTRLVRGVVDRGDGLAYLVNAAGVQAPRGSFADLDDSDWDRLVHCNLRAVLETCRAAVGAMESGASIVNVASISGTVGVPGIVAYGAIKAAVAQLSRGLAVEVAPRGVRVNAVAPGYVRTAMTASMLDDADRAREVAARIPIGRVAEPQEVGEVILFLVSAWSRYVTGEVVHVDGGYRAQ